MEARALVARDRIAKEVLGGEIMPEAQRQRILQRIEDMSADLEPTGDQELASKEAIRKDLIASIPLIVKRNVVGDERYESVISAVTAVINSAFDGEEEELEPVTLTGFVLAAVEKCLGLQAELLEEAFLARHQEPAEDILKELVSKVLRELSGITVNDLSPFERRRMEEFVETARDEIFP